MHTASFLGLNPGGFHRLVYHQWGDPDNERVLVCVHGLARNSRDFDDLARALSRDYRVVCPDVAGRGESDWLPKAEYYQPTQYLNDLVALLAHLRVTEVDWLGTSMGGILGMMLAAQPHTPIRRLVLNDVGIRISARSLARIGRYVSETPHFADLDQVVAWQRTQYAAYQGISDAQWLHLARHGSRPRPEGGLALHYDPAIGRQAAASATEDVDLEGIWRQIPCPQLLIWGQESDVLDAETVASMEAHPQLTLSTWPGIGHAPSLMQAEQIAVVQDWLRGQRLPGKSLEKETS